jgi:hypothetical protein
MFELLQSRRKLLQERELLQAKIGAGTKRRG